MKLLILGAGGHGKVVAEVAADCGYDEIAFLDDHNAEAIGPVSSYAQYVTKFDAAFVGIGNNAVRCELLEKLSAAGFEIPVLIHPTAYVSPTATVGAGTVIEPKALVNTNADISKGCIISVGAIVDHDTVLGRCCHVNAGAIVKAGGRVESLEKLEAGQVVLGYGHTTHKL